MSKEISFTVDAPVGRRVVSVRYERRGAGDPLLLLHGIGHHWQAWGPVLDLLAAEREVVAVDLPGFGASSALPDGMAYDLDTFGPVLGGLCTALGVEKPHVAGNSLGGLLALELGRLGLARSVTALSPPVSGPRASVATPSGCCVRCARAPEPFRCRPSSGCPVRRRTRRARRHDLRAAGAPGTAGGGGGDPGAARGVRLRIGAVRESRHAVLRRAACGPRDDCLGLAGPPPAAPAGRARQARTARCPAGTASGVRARADERRPGAGRAGDPRRQPLTARATRPCGGSPRPARRRGGAAGPTAPRRGRGAGDASRRRKTRRTRRSRWANRLRPKQRD